jgi:uncharacterized protein YdaU (DUF1376 family)
MHYFKMNIGDYAKKTGRLSMTEHGAFTLLLHACYDRERFPTEAEAIEWAWARSEEEIAAVKFVLARFFTLEDGVYVQKRVQEEVEAYQRMAAKNAEIATTREKNKTNRERSVHEPLTSGHQDSTPLVKPLTINQETNNHINPPTPLTGETIKARRVRGTRLPDDWGLDDEHESGIAEDVRTVARELKSDLGSDWTTATLRYHLSEFRNHFQASSKANALKSDWLAAWRNWCSRAMREMPMADPVRRDRQAAAARQAVPA